MSKFGLLDGESELRDENTSDFADKLASFPSVKPREPINLAEFDAAAARHGFTSREAAPLNQTVPSVRTGRRRVNAPEPTRHLAIRLVPSQYERFVAYADRHRLTYHDALARLLDSAVD